MYTRGVHISTSQPHVLPTHEFVLKNVHNNTLVPTTHSHNPTLSHPPPTHSHTHTPQSASLSAAAVPISPLPSDGTTKSHLINTAAVGGGGTHAHAADVPGCVVGTKRDYMGGSKVDVSGSGGGAGDLMGRLLPVTSSAPNHMYHYINNKNNKNKNNNTS